MKDQSTLIAITEMENNLKEKLKYIASKISTMQTAEIQGTWGMCMPLQPY